MIDEKHDVATPYGEAARQAGSQDVRETAREAAEAGKERLGEVREAAQSGLDDAKAAVREQNERAKSSAADEIHRTADGLEAAARELEGSPQHDLLQEAADGLKQISQAIDGKSIGEMVSELSAFGRRNPLAYLGGAAFAGFALARFARASTTQTEAGPPPDAPYGGTLYGGGSPDA